MSHLTDYFKYINDTHWANSLYQWLFYVGVLLIILFQKNRMAKIVFGWVPLLYLLVCFNPASYRIMYVIWSSPDAYYVRMFSFIPLIACIAAGLMQIIVKVRGHIKPILLLIMACGIVLTGNNFYKAEWMRPADNIQKVPQAALEVDKILPKDQGTICVAFPLPLNIYMRQIDSSIMMPYGRYVDSLGECLSKPITDAKTVMRMSGKEAVDYIVVAFTLENLNAFRNKGYKPYAGTNMYLVYKVEGVPRVTQTFNSKRQVVRKDYLDAEGQLELCDAGYTTALYEYDNGGNRIQESYFDHDTPVHAIGGYASVQYTFYSNGEVKSISHLDRNGQPMNLEGRFETRKKYNISGKVIREDYYDPSGAPMKRTDGLFASRVIQYHSSGRIAGESFLDEKGGLTRSSWGYAKMSRVYNEEMTPVGEIYYDDDGSLLGEVGQNSDSRILMDHFVRYSDGIRLIDEHSISVETTVEGNYYAPLFFQLRDVTTGETLVRFGNGYEPGGISGEYHHELPGGLYELTFTFNGHLINDSLSSTVYLNEGDVLDYNYQIDSIEGGKVRVSDFHIGRNAYGGWDQE